MYLPVFIECYSVVMYKHKHITLMNLWSKSKLENSLNYRPQQEVTTAYSSRPGYPQLTDAFRSIRTH